jgi:hypothetical protein
MIESLNLAIFSEHLNTGFRLRLGEADVIEAQLVEVADNGSTPDQEQFSVLFRAPRDHTPVQGLYSIEHEKLGKFEMFLVPVKPDKNWFYYEAIFNRLIEVE